MKTKRILMTSITAMAVISCAEKNLAEPVFINPVFTIKAQFEKGTKTALVSGGKVDWLAADIIGVYDNVAASTVAFENKTGDGPMADFEGSLSAGADKTTLYAIYPYSGTNAAGIGTFTAMLPGEQIAKLNTFASNLSISVGKSVNGSFCFRNACALLKFKINSSTVAKVVFSGYNGTEPVAGNCTIGISEIENTIAVTATDDAVKEVSLVPAGDATTLAPGIYYLVILPGSFDNGIQMSLVGTDNNVIATRKSSGAIEFRRSTVTDLGALDSSDETPAAINLSENGTANSYYVSLPGTLYSFDVTKKGNGEAKSTGNLKYSAEDITIDPKAVLVLWYNCLQNDSAAWKDKCPIDISSLTLTVDGKAEFKTPDTFVNGNVVIIALDSALDYSEVQATDHMITNANILWSWNIIASENYSPEYGAVTIGGVTVMNRDLGAVIDPRSAANSFEYAAGCGNYYQWGRKDPFPTPSSVYYSDSNPNKLTLFSQEGLFFTPTYTPIPVLSRGEITSGDQQVANQIFSASITDFGVTAPYWQTSNTFAVGVEHAVKNPHIYYSKSDAGTYNVRWFSTNGSVYKEAWGESTGKATAVKTIYDPCPQGWHIMSKTDWCTMIDNGATEPVLSSDDLGVIVGDLYFPAHPMIHKDGWFRERNDGGYSVRSTCEYYCSTGGWFLDYLNYIYSTFMARYGLIVRTTTAVEYVKMTGGNPSVTVYSNSCSENNGMPVRCVRE